MCSSLALNTRQKRKATAYDYVYRELQQQSLLMVNKKSLHELTLKFMEEHPDLIGRIKEDLRKNEGL